MSSQERIAASRAAGTFETDHALLEAMAANNYARGASDMAGRAVSDVEALFALIADEQERVEERFEARHDQYTMRLDWNESALRKIARRVDSAAEVRRIEAKRCLDDQERIQDRLIQFGWIIAGQGSLTIVTAVAFAGHIAGWW